MIRRAVSVERTPHTPARDKARFLRTFLILSLITTTGALWSGLPRASAAPSIKTNTQGESPLTPGVYWGAYISGSTYGYNNPPGDTRPIDAFESHTQKSISILRFGQPWSSGGNLQPFYQPDFDTTRSRGYIPMINWGSWESCCGANQPAFSLSNIINGQYDTYIRTWATAARNWGHPFFMEFDDEMNGHWYPWSEDQNGNSTGQYVQMWRHVHDIFTQVGATNVTWVWAPNDEYSGSLPLDGLYPGDSYVDWAGMIGFNWGTNPVKPDHWYSFQELFGATYDHLGRLAPTKPIMMSETASSEYGGSKAAWITDVLGTELPINYPRIKGFVWYNWNSEGEDWVIETSSSSQAAFAAAIQSPYYTRNSFANLNISPIPPDMGP